VPRTRSSHELSVTTQFNADPATFAFSTKVTSDLVRVGAACKF
jgi:hypothetical protein